MSGGVVTRSAATQAHRVIRVRALVAAVRAKDGRGRRAIAKALGFTESQVLQMRAVIRAKRARKLAARLANGGVGAGA